LAGRSTARRTAARILSEPGLASALRRCRCPAGALVVALGDERTRRLLSKMDHAAVGLSVEQQLDFGGDQISPAKRSIAARQPYTTSVLRRPARVCGFSARPFLCPTATARSRAAPTLGPQEIMP